MRKLRIIGPVILVLALAALGSLLVTGVSGQSSAASTETTLPYYDCIDLDTGTVVEEDFIGCPGSDWDVYWGYNSQTTTHAFTSLGSGTTAAYSSEAYDGIYLDDVASLTLGSTLSGEFEQRLVLLSDGGDYFKAELVSESSSPLELTVRWEQLTDPPATGPTYTHIYSVKVVCTPTLGNPAKALTKGTYRTVVNVHNPWEGEASIAKWVTLVQDQGEPAISGDTITETLGPMGAFEVDCADLKNDFGLPTGTKVSGGEGFLVIKANADIDVVAVYTAQRQTKTKDGLGTSIDVEYIQPKFLEQ